MEWFEFLERSLTQFVMLTKFTLEAISVFCIALGLLKVLQQTLMNRRRLHQPLAFDEIRLTFGTWLALALEFQLGADILATTITPSFEALGRLALIAFIRTFLNYFLGRELETYHRAETERQKGLAIRAGVTNSSLDERYDA